MKTRHPAHARRGIRVSALAAIIAASIAGIAHAQEQEQAPAPAAGNDAVELDGVVVTGSRIKRSQVEGPSPVTIVTSEDLQKQGFVTVHDALSTLTQNSGFVQNELITDGFTPNANMINLRSLGPGRTLVLVNGRRVAEYPLPYNAQSNFVNLTSIPTSAVERIEVLSGGASAIYGSDAVAGVVNIITKTNFEGDLVRLRAGTTTQGGGDTGNLQWVGGRSGDNWNVTYAFEALNREPVYAYQRDFMDSWLDGPTDAARLPSLGLGVIDRLAGNSYFDTTADGNCDRFFGHFVVRETGAGRRCAQFDAPAFQSVRSSDDNLSAYASANYTLGNGAQLFADVGAWRSKSVYASGILGWSTIGTPFYDPNFDTIVSTLRLFQVEETGRDALEVNSREQAWSVTGGIRGGLFDNRFDYEAAFSHSKYTTDVSNVRLIDAPLTRYFLGESLGPDPIFGAFPSYALDFERFITPMTPEQFASISRRLVSKAESSADQLSFTLSGDLFELPAGAAGFAAVIEAASQEYLLTPDPASLPTAPPEEITYNYSDTGGGGSRDRYALGVEFSLPLLDSLKASLAARYDKYDDITAVDDAVTWNAGLEWRPVERLLLRSSYATSFRAPDMHYVFADESASYNSIRDEYLCRVDGLSITDPDCINDDRYNYMVQNFRRGNPDLEEETGDSWTFGFVWDITDSLSLQADYYRIEIENGVNDLSSGRLLRIEAGCRLGTDRDGNPVDAGSELCLDYLARVNRIDAPGTTIDEQVSSTRRVPINSALERTSGIDASLRYRLDTDRLGAFDFNLSWSHTLDYERTQYVQDGVIETRDSLFNYDFRSRIAATAAWSKDDWNVALFGTRVGSLPNWGETARVAPYMLYNANVTRKITDRMTLGVFVNNLLDTKPPKDGTFEDYPFFFYAYDPIGREVFAQIEYRFD